MSEIIDKVRAVIRAEVLKQTAGLTQSQVEKIVDHTLAANKGDLDQIGMSLRWAGDRVTEITIANTLKSLPGAMRTAPPSAAALVEFEKTRSADPKNFAKTAIDLFRKFESMNGDERVAWAAQVGFTGKTVDDAAALDPKGKKESANPPVDLIKQEVEARFGSRDDMTGDKYRSYTQAVQRKYSPNAQAVMSERLLSQMEADGRKMSPSQRMALARLREKN